MIAYVSLVLLAAEGLSCLLKANEASGHVGGLQVAPLAPSVNHLLFVDDSLLFFVATLAQAENVKRVLKSYCDTSGQRINNEKSSIFFSKGCPVQLKESIKQNLHVQNESLSERYLGMPTDVGHSKNGTFKYLRD